VPITAPRDRLSAGTFAQEQRTRPRLSLLLHLAFAARAFGSFMSLAVVSTEQRRIQALPVIETLQCDVGHLGTVVTHMM